MVDAAQDIDPKQWYSTKLTVFVGKNHVMDKISYIV